MPRWFATLAWALSAFALPAQAMARADDRTFDPDFWAHPRYIDPAFDLEAALKTRPDEETPSPRTGAPERARPRPEASR